MELTDHQFERYARHLILDEVVVPAMIFSLLFNLILGFLWWDLLLGAVIGGGFFAAQYYLSKGKWIGGGDIRLGALMGFILGWKMLLVALMLAYISGAVIGIVLMALNKKKMSSEIPFGTFLAAATYVTIIHGEKILNWYFGLLS